MRGREIPNYSRIMGKTMTYHTSSTNISGKQRLEKVNLRQLLRFVTWSARLLED